MKHASPKRFLRNVFVLIAAAIVPVVYAAPVNALVGAHSYTNGATGDVFLGGDYIEVGISRYGSFGTTSGQAKPSGFYGTANRNHIGMSSNAAGFGESPDTRIDYFLPGDPEERWVIGYKIGGTPTTASNSLLKSSTGISNYTVTDQTSGDLLKASGVGTLNSRLETKQVVSFNKADKFFKNEVTLKNVGSEALDSVRFMRTFDPDNTADKGGSSATHNEILYTHAAGDGKAVVLADTSNNNSDPVFLVNGSRSPILFYSNDSRARVSTFGFTNTNPYAAQAYDSALAKGSSANADQAITITVDVGTLAAGASETFVYYTSLDNRDIEEVLEEIEESIASDADNIADEVEDAAPNNGDGNGDGTKDSLQPNVTSLPNSVVGGSAYQTLEATGDCDGITLIAVKPVSDYGKDGSYNYPLGMTDFSLDCAAPGDSADITLYYDKQYDTTGWTARKFINGTFKAIPGATFSTATVGSQTVTTLSYTVTDGGELDVDGAVNGTIVDPAGPAVLAVSTAAAPNTGLVPENALVPIIVLGMGAGAILYGARTNRFEAKKQ